MARRSLRSTKAIIAYLEQVLETERDKIDIHERRAKEIEADLTRLKADLGELSREDRHDAYKEAREV